MNASKRSWHPLTYIAYIQEVSTIAKDVLRVMRIQEEQIPISIYMIILTPYMHSVLQLTILRVYKGKDIIHSKLSTNHFKTQGEKDQNKDNKNEANSECRFTYSTCHCGP